MKNIINRIKNDKVLFFLSILIIGVFLVLIIRITYSYLAAFINEATGNLNIGSDTTDKLEFFEGDPIDLNVTSTTLPEGGGNYAQSTTYRAEFTANSTTNSAEDSYYVYFNVPANSLVYTGENPEVILTVSQNGTEITNIDGLTYGTYNGVTGFDVTAASGLYAVASDYAITSNSSTTATVQNWTFTLTYLNQSYDQSGNYGNNFNIEFIMNADAKETNEVTLVAENTEIVGSDYTLTNLLGTIGNFEEQIGWSACAYSTSYAKYGSYSCQLNGSAGSPETVSSTSATYTLDVTHMYYGRVEAYLNDSSIASTVSGGIYWPIAEPSFIEGIRTTANSWTTISSVKDRSSFTNGNYPLRLDFNNNNVAGTMYFDGAMLIDLTATYGASYPDKDYLDSHLVYFNDTANIKTINALDSATFKVNNTNNYSAVTCTNNATASIDENGTITVQSITADTVCKLGA